MYNVIVNGNGINPGDYSAIIDEIGPIPFEYIWN